MARRSNRMKIGELANLAGVSVDTLRFYERRGLLQSPPRRASGYRTYAPTAVERVRLVKSAQALGLTLAEVVDFLALLDQGKANCENQRPRLRAVVERLDQEIARLSATRSKIAGLLQRCEIDDCSFGTG